MKAPRSPRAGFTLVELIAALAVLAASLGVVTATLTSLALEPDDPSAWGSRLERARTRVLETGESQVLWPDSAHVDPPVLLLPDGRAVGVAARARSGAVEER